MLLRELRLQPSSEDFLRFGSGARGEVGDCLTPQDGSMGGSPA